MRFIWLCVVLFSLGCANSSREDYDFPEDKSIDLVKQREISLELLTEQIKANPNNATLYLLRSKVNIDKLDFKEAYKDITIAERLSPNSGEILYLKSFILDQLNDNKALENALFAEDQGYENPDLYILISKLYLDRKEFLKADVYLGRAESIYPHNPDIYGQKGRSFALQQDTSQAILNFKKAIKLKPTEFAYYDQLIKIYTIKKQVDSALVYNDRAIKFFPEQKELLYNKGMILESSGFADSSIAIYKQFLKFEPKRGDVYEKIGDLYMKYRNFDAAQKYYTQWIEALPEDINAKLKSARVYMAQGNFPAAKYSLNKSLEKLPNNNILKAELKALEGRIEYFQRASAAYRASQTEEIGEVEE